MLYEEMMWEQDKKNFKKAVDRAIEDAEHVPGSELLEVLMLALIRSALRVGYKSVESRNRLANVFRDVLLPRRNG